MKYEDRSTALYETWTSTSAMVIDEEIKKLMTPEQLEDLENAAFQETIRQSRGIVNLKVSGTSGRVKMASGEKKICGGR